MPVIAPATLPFIAPAIAAPVVDADRGTNHQIIVSPRSIFSASGPVPVAAALKGGIAGIAYSETITAQGGTSPYTFAITAGALPAGTAMSSGGLISGTPTTAATYSFTVKVTDTSSAFGTQAFTIIISAPAAAGGGAFVFLN